MKAGELLFEEEPLALVVFRQHAGSLCHMCGRGTDSPFCNHTRSPCLIISSIFTPALVSVSASPRRFFEGVPYCRDECLARHGDVWKLAKQALL